MTLSILNQIYYNYINLLRIMNHTTLVMFGVLAAAAMLAGVSTVTFANAQTATQRSGDFPIDQQVTLPDSLGQVSVSGTVHPPIPSSIDLSSLPVGGQTQGSSNLGNLANLGGLTGSLGGLTGSLGGGTPASTTSSSGTPASP
jgi:hypothetical protein